MNPEQERAEAQAITQARLFGPFFMAWETRLIDELLLIEAMQEPAKVEGLRLELKAVREFRDSLLRMAQEPATARKRAI